MTFSRRDYRLRLQVLTPLHVGSGETTSCPRETSDQQGETYEVARLSYGYTQEGKCLPAIPGSSLKGTMRELARQIRMDDQAFIQLFGQIKVSETDHNEATGTMGAVYFWGGLLDPRSIERRRNQSGEPKRGTTYLPAYNSDTGVFQKARTAIDAGRGTSKANQLYHGEYVVSGACFDLDFRVEGAGDIDFAAFERVLALMAQERGFTLGGATTQGFGRLKLLGQESTRTDWRIERGAFVVGEAERLNLDAKPDVVAHVERLTLRCSGPFYILDSVPIPPAAEGAKEGSLQQRAARDGKKPHLIGSEIKGALRAKYAWLCALAARTGDPNSKVTSDPNQEDRLFGTIKRRGALRFWVREVRRDPKAFMDTSSVKIDRFSGGAFDSGLFTADVDYGVEFDLEIELAYPALTGCEQHQRDADRNALDGLLDEIKAKGLELGHRTNSGFGWFEVKGAPENE